MLREKNLPQYKEDQMLIKLDPQLKKKYKQYALENDMTLKDLILESLEVNIKLRESR